MSSFVNIKSKSLTEDTVKYFSRMSCSSYIPPICASLSEGVLKIHRLADHHETTSASEWDGSDLIGSVLLSCFTASLCVINVWAHHWKSKDHIAWRVQCLHRWFASRTIVLTSFFVTALLCITVACWSAENLLLCFRHKAPSDSYGPAVRNLIAMYNITASNLSASGPHSRLLKM